MRKLVCGLGNPGNSYKLSRHNMGYMVIEKMIKDEGVGIKPGKGEYLFGEFRYGDVALILLRPLKFMNLSGIPVSEAKNFFEVGLDNLLIVIDDINLPFGNLRLRKGGSDGGHKGLASIIYHLGTENFPRLRIGIGNPGNDMPFSEYVLFNFSDEEQKKLPEIINNAVNSIKIWSIEGIERAMSITNRKVL